ncbi:expressed unknown protein [Seminavis robusta]|uniref:Uncharacterized protein n=1 Tax=Seminavis robusta TaxID=568900 RepID=A0A9N8EPY4_9STRA|nr:expressed unknown protein [Seminavis robusta]|eukprot:Sro1737_g294420.1 n/a (348) ;mRNA; f:2606-3649
MPFPTPLSWADTTAVGFGPPDPSTDAEVTATYAHCLVHRWEGSHVGELNMVGYSNANFWGKATVRRAEKAPASLVPYEAIRKEMESLLGISDAPSSETVQTIKEPLSSEAIEAGRTWFEEWIKSDLPDGGWEPRALNELCKTLEGLRNPDDPKAEFGSRAAQLECDVLIQYCLEKAGYVVPEPQSRTKTNAPQAKDTTICDEDRDTALRAAGRVSSAHSNSFQQNGIIIIRNALIDGPETVSSAAVACRLMGAPACRNFEQDDGSPSAYVYYTDQPETVGEFDLSPGDLLVSSFERISSHQASLVTWQGAYVACSAEDNNAVYRDILFGTRGETPTTVIQWSKGTIF